LSRSFVIISFLILLFSTHYIISQELPLTIEISKELLDSKQEFKDLTANVETIGLAHPTIKEDDFLSFILHKNFLYVAKLGGQSILKFDRNGKFLKEIIPEENSPINFLSNFWIRNDNLFIYDTTLGTVLKINFDGKVTDQIKVPISNPSSVITTDTELWLDMNRKKIYGKNNNERFNLLCYDFKSNVLSKKVKYGFSLPIIIGSGLSNFSIDREKVYYQQPHSTSVFELIDKDVKEVVTYNFDDLWPYNQFDKTGVITRNELLDLREDESHIFFIKTYMGTDFVLSEFQINSSIYYILTNKNSKQKNVVDQNIFTDYLSVCGWFGGNLGLITRGKVNESQQMQLTNNIGNINNSNTSNSTHTIMLIEFLND